MTERPSVPSPFTKKGSTDTRIWLVRGAVALAVVVVVAVVGSLFGGGGRSSSSHATDTRTSAPIDSPSAAPPPASSPRLAAVPPADPVRPAPGAPVVPVVPPPPPPPEAANESGEAPEVLAARARVNAATTQTHDEVASQLEQIRSAALSKCWSDAPSGGSKLNVTYSLGFSQNGDEITRAVNVSGDDVPVEVQNCLRDYPVPPFHSPATSQHLSVDVQVAYP